MNDKIKVILDPQEYRGWTLSFCKSHDRQSDWQARKNGAFLSANCPEQLYWKIEEEEKQAQRIEPPIRALWKSPWGGRPGWIQVEIHTLVGKGCHFRVVEDGQEHFANLRDFSLDRESNRERRFIHDSTENRDLMAEARKEEEKMNRASRKMEELLARLRPVSDADVEIAARGGG